MQTTDTRTRRNNISRRQREDCFEAWRATLKPVNHRTKEKPQTKREKIDREAALIFAPLSVKRTLFTNQLKTQTVINGTGNNKKAS